MGLIDITDCVISIQTKKSYNFFFYLPDPIPYILFFC
jgi:hypothetical protein